MTVDMYTLFDFYEDECIDILEKSTYGKIECFQYTSEITKNMVANRIKQQERVTVMQSRHNFSMKKLLLIALIAALFISTFAVAKNYWDLWEQGGAEEITDENRSLVGKETHVSGDSVESNRPIYTIKGNEIIKSVQEGAHIPRTIDIFTAELSGEQFITPEVITTNDAMALFTSPDEKGWALQKGDTLTYQVEMYDNEAVEEQNVAICLIIDGELQKAYETNTSKSITYKITAGQDAYYNFAIINASSDTITLHEGTIQIQQKNNH